MQKPDPYAPFDEYLAWRDQQVCSGCGKRIIDRSQEEVWITETLCEKCFLKELQDAHYLKGSQDASQD